MRSSQKEKRMPSRDLVRRARIAIKREADYHYFFEKLTTPDWIEPLREDGWFREPPKPEVEGDHVLIPIWPASRYLVRMAALAPDLVMDVALEIETDNARVHEDLIQAALAMPPKVAARIVPRAIRWITGRYQLLLPRYVGDLMSYLARERQTESALRLARAILQLEPDPRIQEKAETKGPYRPHAEPQPRFDFWEYQDILERNIPELVAAAGIGALKVLCTSLSVGIGLSLLPGEDEKVEALRLAIWRPAIENHGQNARHGVVDVLISAVRDASRGLAANNHALVPAILDLFRTYKDTIFERLAFYLLAEFPTAAPDLVAAKLTDRNLFDDWVVRHEYYRLAEKGFRFLSLENQEAILGWIEAGPEQSSLVTRLQDGLGRPPTDQEVRHAVESWQLRHLAPLVDSLPPEWRQRREAMLEEVPAPDHPDFVSYGSEWVGSTSPVTADELVSMDVAAIVAFLQTWKPSSGWREATPDGLAAILRTVIARDPGCFADNAVALTAVEPLYVDALLSGLREAAAQNRSFGWDNVLTLCRQVVSVPYVGPDESGIRPDRALGWARKSTVDLLRQGFTSGPAEIPIRLRREVWDVLLPLADDPDPTPTEEETYGGQNMDPLTLSLNTIRGAAMHAIIAYALWVRRHESGAAKPEGQFGFDQLPEVRDVLNRHLDPEIDPSPAVHSVYGQYFPNLVWLDPDWAAGNSTRVFPSDDTRRDLLDAAWDAYLAFAELFPPALDLLSNVYARAVERIGEVPGNGRRIVDPAARLAEHLMVMYWRGRISLEDSDGLVARFYARAPDSIRAHAIDFIGRSLRNTEGEVEAEVLDRLRRLWEARVTAVTREVAEGAHPSELVNFGWWFVSRKFADDWSLQQLEVTLRRSRRVDADDDVANRLAELAPGFPLQTVACLRLMIEGAVEGWRMLGWLDDARTVLEAVLNGSDESARRMATEVVDLLVARGQHAFRSLLGRSPGT
jgi:hypothetical protein